MDCYSEYKYNHYQQQQHQHNIHHTYYNNSPSMRFGLNPASDGHHQHHPQSPFYDGFSRHNHAPPPTYSHVPSSYPPSFEAGIEGGNSFCYPNMHAGGAMNYYGNHLNSHHPQHLPQQQQPQPNPFESYRSAPSSYRNYSYGYHNNLHYPAHHQHHHQQQSPQQQQQQQQLHPPHPSPQQQPPQPQHYPTQSHPFYPQFNGSAAAEHFNHYASHPIRPSPQQQQPPQPPQASTPQQQQSDSSSCDNNTNLRSTEFPSSCDASDSRADDQNSNKTEGEGNSRDDSGEVDRSDRTNGSSDEGNVQQVNSNERIEVESNDGERGDREQQANETKNNIDDRDSDSKNFNGSSGSGVCAEVEESGEQEVAKKLKSYSLSENDSCKENHKDTSATDYPSDVSGARVNKLSSEKLPPAHEVAHPASRLSTEQSEHLEHSNNFGSTPTNDNNGNAIQNEYLFGLNQIQEHLDVSIRLLTKTEQNFAMNITNLLIQYGESWIRLTNELFERDGFIVDIKSLYKFTSNIKARIKFDISRSIKEFSAGRITYMNKKLHQAFLASLFAIFDQYVGRIKVAIDYDDGLMECWDDYKIILLEIGFDATNVLLKSSFEEIERLYNSFHDLRQKILAQIKSTKNILFYEYPSPLDNRLMINLYTHNFHDRSLTPIGKLSAFGYNHHCNNLELSHNYLPHQKHRYPMSPWYSHDYYNNWILNPDDRRPFPDTHSFFSSMRNGKKNHKYNPEKPQKASSPSLAKRTKRKAKVPEETLVQKEPSKELIKNLTPLPGFLQTFGQTEIGRFSEAFYISSDSPHYQYNNESDVDSPQPYDFDSLDGPIPKSFYMCGSENEFDSPMSSFSEIMCKDF